MQARTLQYEKTALEALRNQIPVRGLPGVRIRAVKAQPTAGFDVQFESLESGKKRVLVLWEFKSADSPKHLEGIAPWIRRMNSLREGISFALFCPALSPRSQAFCIENGIDFLDLAGNVSINVPGTFTLQRLGMQSKEWSTPSDSVPSTNVFSGRSSRVLRVLLEAPRVWTLTGIANELQAETKRFGRALLHRTSRLRDPFRHNLESFGEALYEQLWIRRQGSSIMVPEPRRLLLAWAEKYKERYRWRLRNSFETANPFGAALSQINNGLKQQLLQGLPTLSSLESLLTSTRRSSTLTLSIYFFSQGRTTPSCDNSISVRNLVQDCASPMPMIPVYSCMPEPMVP